MKITTIVISFVCLSQAALADDLATPTPTPAIYRGRGAARHQEQLVRRNQQEAAADSRAQQRATKKAGHGAAQSTQAQVREAAREREQAQRDLAAENRREARNEKPQLTSDLMSRMGFSEKEIAEQKAKEQSASPDSKKPADPAPPGH